MIVCFKRTTLLYTAVTPTALAYQNIVICLVGPESNDLVGLLPWIRTGPNQILIPASFFMKLAYIYIMAPEPFLTACFIYSPFPSICVSQVRVFENRVLRRIFRLKRDEVTGE
jgi:hypothetical protein